MLIKTLLILYSLLPLSLMGSEIMSTDLESGDLNQIFTDVNRYDGIIVDISTDYAHSGTKSIKISYPQNEAGVELKIAPFPPTQSLYVRKYEYFAPGWEGNWPVGLKTSRYFTTPDYKINDSAYMSEKLIWQTYQGNPDDLYGRGMNNAIYNLDLEDTYESDEIFGNGLPYIRAGHWYKFETWMVLNSNVDIPDGILKIWIDNLLVYSKSDVEWRSSSRGVPNGVGWQSMWFGGNYSGAVFGAPTETLHRYIDDLYVSTSADFELRPNPPVLSNQ